MSTPSRNDPCPCGSGKKYKKCCMNKTAETPGFVVQKNPASEHGVNVTNVAPPSELLLQGVALHQAGRLYEARTVYQNVLKRNPADSHALHYLGLIALQQENFAEAVRLIESAIAINRRIPAFHCNLGNAYKGLGNADAAITAFIEAVRLDPKFQAAYSNLGNTYLDQGRLEEAADAYRKALELRPDFAEAHSNLANVYRDQGRLADAAAGYRKALELKPDFSEAYSNLLYLHAFTRDVPATVECAEAAGWENTVLNAQERRAAHELARALPNPARAGRKLKLGIASAQLGQHSVAEFLEPILENLDRERLHLTLYATALKSGPRAERFRQLADDYKSLVTLGDEDAARLIRSDGIDVLIDTTGHMRHCRLGILARRAAPVQCHYIGYHGTSGLTEMDWLIADAELIPPSLDDNFCEQVWRLPHLRMVYRGDASLPESNWQPDADGVVWLGSFNNMSKIRDESLSLWAKVMNAIPQSKLLLKDRRAGDASVQQRVLSGLAACGIDAGRVEFVSWTPDWASHMALYDRVDIALDTVPLNSETTAFDALWMGVPILALEGDWMGARMTSAILKAFDRQEWVARDEDHYAAIAAALAEDVEGRRAMRAAQRSRMAASPLCDAAGLSRILEDAFEAMFDQWWSRKPGNPA